MSYCDVMKNKYLSPKLHISIFPDRSFYQNRHFILEISRILFKLLFFTSYFK
ncbi:hypothetical protein H1P_2890004 [Hyella patelloides LEGE 07179]|uniref:Uncharacterized protein n=1 Tax=Hyella patelloides LEGE 07179 TaxID=945734 RepID=A0A563VTQ9_9CYAN|nr:hypothetical protein H1P_2890004 [Hyella patelloides LEGE 07179]